jgi:hypothetical protein
MNMLLAHIVSANITLAQIFYLVAIIIAGLWVFSIVSKREEPYWPLALPLVLVFVALGLFFSI